MTPGREAVDRLGTAFRGGDVETVLAEFAATGEVVYAGSEAGEVAVGRSALRTLLAELLGRDERYSWEAGTVHELVAGDVLHVVAEAELTVHTLGPEGWHADERLPYRVSGALEHDSGSVPAWRWRSCLGSEPVAPVAE